MKKKEKEKKRKEEKGDEEEGVEEDEVEGEAPLSSFERFPAPTEPKSVLAFVSLTKNP